MPIDSKSLSQMANQYIADWSSKLDEAAASFFA
jgi:hypothetical protein